MTASGKIVGKFAFLPKVEVKCRLLELAVIDIPLIIYLYPAFF